MVGHFPIQFGVRGRLPGRSGMKTHRCWTLPTLGGSKTGEKEDLKSGLGVILGSWGGRFRRSLPFAKPDLFRSEDRFLTPKESCMFLCVFFLGGGGKKREHHCFEKGKVIAKKCMEMHGNAPNHDVACVFLLKALLLPLEAENDGFQKDISLSRATCSGSTFGFWVFNFDSTLAWFIRTRSKTILSQIVFKANVCLLEMLKPLQSCHLRISFQVFFSDVHSMKLS